MPATTTPAKKKVYFDLDNTMVDFGTGIAALSDDDRAVYDGRYDECPGIFALMDPIDGAVEAFTELSDPFDCFILSTAPWLNPSAWADKLRWVHRYLGAGPTSPAYKRLILSHHKDLNRGDYLIDDRPKNGAERFGGLWIPFGSAEFPDWPTVTGYLLDRA